MRRVAQAQPAQAELAVIGTRAPAAPAAVVGPGLVLRLSPLLDDLGCLGHCSLSLGSSRRTADRRSAVLPSAVCSLLSSHSTPLRFQSHLPSLPPARAARKPLGSPPSAVRAPPARPRRAGAPPPCGAPPRPRPPPRRAARRAARRPRTACRAPAAARTPPRRSPPSS